MKNLFKRKKEKFPTTPVVRSVKEITDDYSRLLGETGEMAYQCSVYKAKIAELHQDMKRLNREMGARQELDRQAAAEAEKAKEVKSV